MRILRILLPLLALLMWSTAAQAQDDSGGQYTLTTRCIPEDGGWTNPSSSNHNADESVNVWCGSHSGFRFVQWEDESGNVVSDSSDFYYTMPARNVTLTARFEFDPGTPSEPSTPSDYVRVFIEASPAGSGHFDVYGADSRISDNEWRFAVGRSAEIYAWGDNGWRFVKWTENGEDISNDYRIDFTVAEGGRHLVAHFVYDPGTPSEPESPVVFRRITLKSNPENAASLYGEGEYPEGSTANVYGYANEHYVFRNWTDDLGNVVSDALDFNYTVPSRHVTLTANFRYQFNPSTPDEPGSPDNDDHGVTQRPRISMYDDTHVMMLSSTAGATIHYTLDGSDPTTASSVYSSPVFVPSNLTVKAMAVKAGLENSPVTTYQVTAYHAEAPEFTFRNYRVEISSATPGAVIHYTIGRNDPTEDSAVYQEPLELNDGAVLKAIACADGLSPSEVRNFVFQRSKYLVEAPVLSMNSEGRLVIVPAVEGSTIRYTTDGTAPNAESAVYTAPLALDGNLTVKAYATHPNYFDSPVGQYVLSGFKVEPPVLTFTNRAVVITVPTPGASIRYTVDGSTPTAESALYGEPLALTEDCTVTAMGFKDNYDPSEAVSYTFIYVDHQVARPEATYDPDSRTVTMTSPTENASIRYTTDGSIPTATTGTAYTAPFVVEGNKTFTMRAFRADMFDSETATLEVNDQSVPTPTASFANRRLTLSCTDPEAAIYYTLDGSDPTAAATRYTAPIELTEDRHVRFIAIREGYNNSAVAEYWFVYADHQVAKPTVTYDPATAAVTMTCATENASIRYTTDGSVPTATTGTAYSVPVAVEGNRTYTVRAFRDDLFDSETVTLEVNDRTVPTPTASFAALRLILSCPDANAEIHYTTDGSTPTASSTLYTAPVALTGDCTVRFIAVREGYNDSQEASFVYVRASYTVRTPGISYDPDRREVSITCATQGATVRYTTDGSVPTASTGNVYGGPFAVSGNRTIKAVAFAEGLFDSEVATMSINDQTVPTPTASFSSLRLTLSCSDAEAAIHYTLDGTAPTASSTLYTEPLALTEDCTVRFIAVREGYNDSEVASFEFRKSSYQAATPAMNYDPDTKVLTMSCATQGAVIRYTTDGSVPTATTGTVYTEPITVNGNHTYIAVAFAEGLFDSEPAVLEIDSQRVPTPTASYSNRMLTLRCPDANAEIHYTLDGSTPTAASTLYTEPLALTEDCTVRFIAVREGYNDSAEATFEFRRADHTVATPAISYDPARSLVTISCATEGAEIRYTTDGSVPTAESGNVYTEPFAVSGNRTIRAVAFADGLFGSEVATMSINDQTVPTPTASFSSLRLTLSCSDAEAAIHYTLDGSAPTASSTLYTEPLALTEDCTVRFIAVREGYNDSEVASLAFRKSSYQTATPVMDYDTDSKTLTISCATEGAEIRYTTDGSVPTATTGTVYTGPITVNGNHTYIAVAFAEGLFDSEPAVLEIDSQRVPTPTASYSNRMLTLRCPDANAEIHYTLDGTAPTAASTHYTVPVELTEDCTVRFIAMRDGYNDSAEAIFEFRRADHTVATPAISYDPARSLVTISCATEGAEIRYTTDGSVPTAESGNVYTEPFAVSGNRTIRAVAFADGLFGSEVATMSINDQTVPTPTASFSSLRLTLSCSDAEAAIHYTLDGSAPTASSTLYTEPLALTEDCTVRFIAVREGYNDSAEAIFEFRRAYHTVATPVINHDSSNGMVTITCATEGAEIRYTVDGSVPTAESGNVYTEPFTVSGNLTVTAVAFADDYFDSEPAVNTVDSYKVATPYGRFDAESRILTLLCNTAEATILYRFDAEEDWQRYDEPIVVESNGTVYAKATRDGWTDSDIAEIVISDVKCADVTFSPYDGRNLSLSTEEEGAEIRYTLDGGEPAGGAVYTAPIDVEGLCTVRAVAVKEGYMDSDIAELVITHYADERHAETSAEGLLEAAFGWHGSAIPDESESFSIEGKLNAADYAFLRSQAGLRHLDLGKVADAHIPANAFAGSRLISVSLPEDIAECADGILAGADRLTSVVWNSRMDISEGMMRDIANPNMLLYVAAEVGVPDQTDLNVVADGVGDAITLHYGYPFYPVRGFHAARVSLTHEFTQTTGVEGCSGWETLVLPFTPAEIRHEVNGPAVPFAVWNYDLDGDRPFWLYRATSSGWDAASSMEAGVPYLLSMPNSPDYSGEFNLGGKVTFSAEGVDLGPDSCVADTCEWVGGTRFMGSFMPVEETGVLVLNVNSTAGGLQPGSTFVADVAPVPFGAYVSGAGARRAMPLFGDLDAVEMLPTADAGLEIGTPAPGVLRISSARECRVTVTTATGVTVRTLSLKPGETVTLEGLTRDLYIVGGRKVMVR